jgi:hypothetical protein
MKTAAFHFGQVGANETALLPVLVGELRPRASQLGLLQGSALIASHQLPSPFNRKSKQQLRTVAAPDAAMLRGDRTGVEHLPSLVSLFSSPPPPPPPPPPRAFCLHLLGVWSGYGSDSLGLRIRMRGRFVTCTNVCLHGLLVQILCLSTMQAQTPINRVKVVL